MPAPSVTIPAPAKLNLFLHITGQRDDGYHNLQTLFQLLDYGDQLRFTAANSGGIRLRCNNQALQTSDNLIIRAAHALEQASGKTINIDIELTKRLPMGGGVGGGSSDCATTLLTLNQLCKLELSSTQLMTIAASLGADVPVFVAGKTAWAESIGDKLTALELSERWFVVLHPQVHVSTAELFKHPLLERNHPAITFDDRLIDQGQNCFEAVARKLYPSIEQAFQLAQTFGQVRLTGTGACLFLSMNDKLSAEAACQAIAQQQADLSPFIAKSVNTSPAITALNNLS
ncbi:4-(cytidine 5'-diphospho)-2-C-methyl-D-erythritol kinase [Reinekea thalattae]|uniref:4-diphosphocytidyl-2-C-methyl-D-erythritol kinase n=1 Tax=Reinekea thalattae TaxID=2593301 RepID=A0A5C8Z726_9GAMM|nr:4-(cytidine 5'-diphospho)-2-C-methyl-D-erythritol kinase [Reinekea thalattae]TXR53752.1 4-(cytidine 5'-diphospho)-2-C-methyl-D-erythritol kinase [Reinekea thalattae]